MNDIPPPPPVKGESVRLPARGFDPSLHLPDEGLQEFIELLAKPLTRIQSIQADCLVANLFLAHELRALTEATDRRGLVFMSRKKATYVFTKRYTSQHRARGAITSTLINVLDQLAEYGLVSQVSKGSNRAGEVARSVYAASGPLEALFDVWLAGPASKLVERPTLVLRSSKGEGKVSMSFKLTEGLVRMEEQLDQLNTVLSAANIRTCEGKPVDVYTSRVFNNGETAEGAAFMCGGRYSGAYQVLKKGQRLDLTIDGERVIELDYRAMHPLIQHHIVYGTEKPDLITYLKGADPYDLTGYPDLEDVPDLRACAKSLFMTMANTPRPYHAHRCKDSFKHERNGQGHIVKLKKLYAKHMYPDKTILAMMVALADHLPALGVSLEERDTSWLSWCIYQRNDAAVASLVIDSLIAKGKPVLCIHDSFIVKMDDAMHLLGAMIEAYQRVLSVDLDTSSATPTYITKATV